MNRAAELEPDNAGVWHRIGQVNALRFDGEAMWPAMERAIELTDDDEQLAELYGELAFESSMRGGMWNPPLDHELASSWIDRALELAPPGTRAQARGLVTRSMWDDDAELADQAIAIALRIDDPVLASYAYFARSGAAFVARDYATAYDWAMRRFDFLDRLNDPDKRAHIYYYGSTAALSVGRVEEARRLVRQHDEFASRLSAHHEVHALAVLLFVEEALGHWDEIRRLQPRVERAVADNAGTPCILNPRTLLSCAVACAETGEDGEAQRLEETAAALGFTGHGPWLHPPPAHLALLRGELDRLGELVDGSGEAWYQTADGGLYGTAINLDALLALGRPAAAEAEAALVAQPGTYLEPFALRTLGLARGDHSLIEQAAERFEALGLDWHAQNTRARAVPSK